MAHEPVDAAPVSGELRFVVHEHYATAHHFDLRLEVDGTLWPWALPKGLPVRSDQNRLAVRVDDHDLDHLDFEDPTPVPGRPEGTIAKSIWDRGTYRLVRSSEGKLVVDLTGAVATGRYSLFSTGGKNWMMHLMDHTP